MGIIQRRPRVSGVTGETPILQGTCVLSDFLMASNYASWLSSGIDGTDTDSRGFYLSHSTDTGNNYGIPVDAGYIDGLTQGHSYQLIAAFEVTQGISLFSYGCDFNGTSISIYSESVSTPGLYELSSSVVQMGDPAGMHFLSYQVGQFGDVGAAKFYGAKLIQA